MKYVDEILKLSDCSNLLEQLYQILYNMISENKIQTAKYQISSLIESMGYIQTNQNYYEYMNWIFKQIIKYNIDKGKKIQCMNESIIDFRNVYESLDLGIILDKQNELSEDNVSGEIWVLNTSVFLVPDYHTELIYTDNY